MAKANKRKISLGAYFRAIFAAFKITFKASPLAMVVKIISSLFNALSPIATTYFAARTTTSLVDAYNQVDGATDQAIAFAIATALVGLVSMLISQIDGYLGQWMTVKIDVEVADGLYSKFLRLSYADYETQEKIDLYDSAKKFTQFFSYVMTSVTGLFTSFVAAIGAIIALGFVSWWIPIVIGVALIPGCYIQFWLSRRTVAHWNNHMEERRLQYHIEGTIFEPSAITDIRMNNLAPHFLNLRKKYALADEQGRLVYERQSIVWRMLADVLESAVELGVLIWVVFQIAARGMPVGQFVFVQQLTSRTFSSLNSVIRELSTIDEDIARVKDYYDFMALPEQSVDVIDIKQFESLEFNNVSFKYPANHIAVLNNINLQILAGERIAIVGENGAGKTTLIKLLAGLYVPHEGRVMINDVETGRLDLLSWHRQIGILLQNFQHYSFTSVRENILLGDIDKKFDSDTYHRSIKESKFDDVIKELEDGERTMLSKWVVEKSQRKGTDLSGGQWQRLALARSFYRDSPVIILDEPTSAIDAKAEADIFKKLFADKSGKTIITISHRLSTVRRADRVIYMEHGAIVEQGTPKELLANKKSRAYQLFESQIDEIK